MLLWLFFADSILVGLAIVVAVVVYPAFREVGLHEWQRFHAHHSRMISFAVGPPWLLQGVLSGIWMLQGPHRMTAIAHGVFALLGVLTTIGGAVPQHNQLSLDRTTTRLTRLQAWHLARTAAWLVATGLVATAVAASH